MRVFSYGLILAGTLMAHTTLAMDKEPVVSAELNALFEEAKRAPNANEVRILLEARNKTKPEETWEICKHQVLGDNAFYQKAAVVGISKRNAIVQFCEALRIEKEKAEPGKIEHTTPSAAAQSGKQKRMLKRVKEPVVTPPKTPAVAPKSPAEPEKTQPKKLSAEKVEKWQKIDVEPAKGDLQARQEHLKAQEVLAQENLAALKAQENQSIAKQVSVLEEKLQEVRKEIEESQKYYDNLSAAIFGIREDLGNIHHFKTFVEQHSHDAPDVFINTFMNTFPNWYDFITNHEAAAQIPLALDISRSSLAHIQKGQLELSAIVRQMEELHHKK